MARCPAPLATFGLVAAALAVTLVAAAPTTAQPVPIECLECSVEVTTARWNGTGLPGDIVGGIFELRNTGDGHDSYNITVGVDADGWVAEADVQTIDDVPPGQGLFASDENNATFRVNVLIPATARAGDSASVTVTVTSETDEAATDTVSEATEALQFYGWQLTCTPEASAQKTKKVSVHLNATNTGNGNDRAAITTTPLAGLSVTDIRSVRADADETVQRSVDLGLGLRLEDGTYMLRWDLRSASDVTATCNTQLTVSGGQGGPGTGPIDTGGDTNEGPAGPLGLALVALVAVARLRRA